MVDRVKGLMVIAGVGAVLGGFAGLGLSFIALSPLVVGGVIGSILPGWCIAPYYIKNLSEALMAAYKRGVNDGFKIISAITLTAVSAAIGVGLAAAATAIFPGAMLGMQSLVLTGAVIGAIAPIAGCFVTDKVDNYIISPIIEHFSSKEKGYKPA
ncbi:MULTISPECIES: hypothetical protein [Wolbachia]|uniref:hypothetical protein n=1 Tax=Wolbachia TaxID=953 RepID=UPI0015FABFCE|nr:MULTISPECIES: hypothetical protein [Wolbachia]MBA8757311.1 hypothetical protein [Wolbachia pipientis]MDE5058702.1 hypothetical protein [Wolbachia endosymbiont of Drosophila baimaii]